MYLSPTGLADKSHFSSDSRSCSHSKQILCACCIVIENLLEHRWDRKVLTVNLACMFSREGSRSDALYRCKSLCAIQTSARWRHLHADCRCILIRSSDPPFWTNLQACSAVCLIQAWRKPFVSLLQQSKLAWAYLQPAKQLGVLQALCHTPLRRAAACSCTTHAAATAAAAPTT